VIDQPNIFYTALKMLGILMVLLGGLYVCLHFVKRLLHSGFTGKPDQLIRVRSIRSIGIKKQIALVEIPGAVLVIGMTGDRMQLLDKIVDADIRSRISAGHKSEDQGQRTV
jgi:flagellar biogenesis protein FliO